MSAAVVALAFVLLLVVARLWIRARLPPLSQVRRFAAVPASGSGGIRELAVASRSRTWFALPTRVGILGMQISQHSRCVVQGTVAFFHPFADGGGGGERVLWWVRSGSGGRSVGCCRCHRDVSAVLASLLLILPVMRL